MPTETLTDTEKAVLDWLRANLAQRDNAGDAEPAVLLVGKPTEVEFLVSWLEDDHGAFLPLGDTETRVWATQPD